MSKLHDLFNPVVSELIWALDGGAGNFTQRIVAQVHQALFDDKLHTGDFLGTETDLAMVFDVSRSTARSALRELEAMGIVQIKVGAKGGASIADLNAERFIDTLAVLNQLVHLSQSELLLTRQAIEGMSAELAAANATPEDMDRLAGLLLEGGSGSCQEIHEAVALASHNRVLLAQLMALRGAGRPEGEEGMAPTLNEQHRSLVALIEAGDGPGARALMLEHLSQAHGGRGPAAEARGNLREEEFAAFAG